jgi:hypothetical protein
VQVLPLPIGKFSEENGIGVQNIIGWQRGTNKFKKTASLETA